MINSTLVRIVENKLLPKDVEVKLNKFLVDKKTGNVSLNIKEGIVLGLKLEEIVHLSPRQ